MEFFGATHGDIHHLQLSNKGLFWGGLAALAVALYTLLQGNLMIKYGTSLILGYAMLIGGVLLFIFSADARILTDTRPITILFLGTIFSGMDILGFASVILGCTLLTVL